MQIHASCAARDGAGVLLLGPPGSGKSDMVLRLIDRGFQLVADDRVDVEDGWACSPSALAGLLEIRGLGIMRLPHVARARVVLAVELGVPRERLPAPERHKALDVPLIRVEPAHCSAPQRIALALDLAEGRLMQHTGAFA